MSQFLTNQLDGLLKNKAALEASLKARKDGDAPNDAQAVADETSDLAKIELRIKELQAKTSPAKK